MGSSIFGNAQEEFVSVNFQVTLDEYDIMLWFTQDWATYIFLVSLCFVTKTKVIG